MDVKKIAELDWCTFVIEHLKDSVSVWKKGNSYFTGPLPFLMVSFKFLPLCIYIILVMLKMCEKYSN